jgi:WhiB family redox-sensing transcriptional regulator
MTHHGQPYLTYPVRPIGLSEDWEDQGLCKGHPNPELWTPLSKASPEAKEGKRICRHCPVIVECLTYALNTDERNGTWGGLTQWERAADRKRAKQRAGG